MAIAALGGGHCAAADGDGAGTVLVTGSLVARTQLESPFAIGSVDRDDIQSAGPMINASEVLQRIPGLVANNRSNFAQDLQISSRGFGARSAFGLRGLRILVDGIPASGPDGQGQVSQFDLPSAQRIEVLRGPFSALYGNSSGGVIALFTAPVRQSEWRLESGAGSFGLRQARLAAQGLAQGWEWQASVAHAEWDGFRPQSGAVKQQAAARAVHRSDWDEFSLQLSALRQPADDPLGLTAAQMAAQPRQTHPLALQYDTRKTLDQRQAGASWRHRLEQGALREWTWSAYTGTRAVANWLAITPATQAAARHGGGAVDFERRFAGTEWRARWEWDDWGLVAGAAIDRQVDDRQGYENFQGTGASQVLGVTGRLRRDEINRAGSRDVYAQSEWPINADWVLQAGLRAGVVDLSAHDRYLSNGDDSGRLRFQYANPVAGLRWRLAPQLHAYFSVARGYESPTLAELAYRADGTGGFNTALKAQSSLQWEAGLKQRSASSDWDLAVFDARTENEIGVATNAGGRSAFQNVGRTLRRGAEWSSRWNLDAAWRLRVSASLLQARYRDAFLTCDGIPCPSANVTVPAGNRIAGTPQAWGFLEWMRRDAQWGDVALEARASGTVAANDRNTEVAAGYSVWAARWSRSWNWGGPWRLEALARVDNLFDRRYVASVIVNDANGRTYEPGAPRNLWMSLRWVSRF